MRCATQNQTHSSADRGMAQDGVNVDVICSEIALFVLKIPIQDCDGVGGYGVLRLRGVVLRMILLRSA
jgi:hypothetical protein